MATAAHYHGGTRGEVSALVCRVGSSLAALPVRDVGETMRALPISPLAGAPPFVRGVTIVRGEAMPVLDAGLLFADAPSTGRRFVTLRTGGRWAALAVDEVLGLRAMPALSDLPPLLRESPSTRQLGILDEQLLLLLEGGRLVPEAVWTSLARTS